MKVAILDGEKSHLLLIEQAMVAGNGNRAFGESMACHLFECGASLLELLQNGEQFDCLLLERRLLDVSGDLILAWLRQNSAVYMPVIMVSSMRLEENIVQSLNAGADDYVCKPFRPLELFARVRRLVAQTRRTQSTGLVKIEPMGAATQSMSVVGYDFDPIASTVTFGGESIVLTEREYRLAQVLFVNLNQLLTRPDLYQAVWQRVEAGGNRALDTHIYRIRTKLKLLPERGFLLRAVYGYGYRLEYSLVKVA